MRITNENTEINIKLRERFCKDSGVPIKIFVEPYFTDRLNLYNEVYNSILKWTTFLNSIDRFKTAEEYFAFYSRVKDNAIEFIKNTDGYKRFEADDFNKFKVNTAISNKDIYKASNIGKKFISIDLQQGCFAALKWYSKDIVGNYDDYGMFIGEFCDYDKHIMYSKHIRQVIFGNCNPRRQTTIEKFLMYKIFKTCIEGFIDLHAVVSFSDDEIVIDATNLYENDIDNLNTSVDNTCRQLGISIHFDVFTLKGIPKTSMYIKQYANKIDLKCIENNMMPFVLRKLSGCEYTENDLILTVDGKLAKLLTPPTLDIEI